MIVRHDTPDGEDRDRDDLHYMGGTCEDTYLVRKTLATVCRTGRQLVVAPLAAQNTSVIAGGPHDLSGGSAVRNTNTSIDGQTCVFCHTPHGGSNSIPLWNRSSPTGASYQLYTSTTSDVTASASQIATSVSGRA